MELICGGVGKTCDRINASTQFETVRKRMRRHGSEADVEPLILPESRPIREGLNLCCDRPRRKRTAREISANFAAVIRGRE
ncbi:hypothetical protein C5Y97_29500 [Blastopirellula marina]|uniref:Uncharacterized protein n=1 Tax=Blastopirellula marina TaxID=124 RepID=A0A2S8F2X8_9BACT|nr:hypothetical protein C5Y98_29485 [Blastopirellula marina]PTL40839.1 hypothetical protein C5Y97_29500 [Blastopirellula marina]